MDLHERLNTAKPLPADKDPFAEVKSRIHFTVIGDLGPQLYNVNMDPEALRERVLADVRDQLAQETGISRDDRQRIALEIADDILGHGPLERLLADETITEIMVNGPYDIWIERGGRLHHSDVQFNDEWHLRRIINKMVAQVGRRIDESSPMVDARLPDGSRVNAVIPPLSLSGPLVTIRKFSRRRLTLDDMIKLGTLSQETVEFLQRCVRAQLNMLISGGTGSGKTTLLNALSTAIPNEERIVTIEDAAELRLNQEHVLRLEARPKDLAGENEVPIRALVRNSLRMRPDRIIVGEVRGAEALDMLQAMNTGHDGSLSTIHANSPRDALSRVETMVLMAGYDLPVRAIREQVSSALDGIIHLDRRGAGHGGRRDHPAGAVQVPDRRGDPRRHDRRRLAPHRAAADVPAEVREARHRAAARPLPGPRAGVRLSRRVRDGPPVRKLALAAASLLALALFAASAASAGGSGLRLVEAKGPPFPVRTLVLSLPSGRKLTAQDVSITENGTSVVDTTLVPASEASRKTFGVVLVLDTSWSMRGKPLAAAVAAEQAFAARRNPNEQLGLIEFNRQAKTVLPLTTSATRISAALAAQPKVATGTHIFDAVAKA